MRLLLLLAGFIMAQSADLGTTAMALGYGCHELNPVYQGSIIHLISVKTGVTLFVSGIALVLRQRNERWVRLILITGMATAGVAATWNFSIAILGYCGG